MNHRPFKSSEPCAGCKKAPRRPHSDYCAPCGELAVKEYQNNYHRTRRKRKGRKIQPCKCGCGVDTVYPSRYATEECKEKGRQAAVDRTNEQRRKSRSKKLAEKEAAKPLTPAQIAAREAEQEKQRAIASELDRKWQKKYWEELGLESVPGQPLASKVVRPPKEVFEQYQQQWKPQREYQPREYWIPNRGDVSY